MKHLACVLFLATATLAAQQNKPPAPVSPAPSNEQQQKYLQMQLQRDQIAAQALEDILLRLSEYRDLRQLQTEIQDISQQLARLKGEERPPNVPPTPPPAPQQERKR